MPQLIFFILRKPEKFESLKLSENKLAYEKEITEITAGYKDIIEIKPDKFFPHLSLKIEISHK